jgi:hypothetical protein
VVAGRFGQWESRLSEEDQVAADGLVDDFHFRRQFADCGSMSTNRQDLQQSPLASY